MAKQAKDGGKQSLEKAGEEDHDFDDWKGVSR